MGSRLEGSGFLGSLSVSGQGVSELLRMRSPRVFCVTLG